MDATTVIPQERTAEYLALVNLLCSEAAPDDPDARRVAEWIAQASIADGHLWRAMGLAERSELSRLIEHHFPALAEGNDRDMRWKKFFYKRLCGWPGFEG